MVRCRAREMLPRFTPCHADFAAFSADACPRHVDISPLPLRGAALLRALIIAEDVEIYALTTINID